MKTKGSAIKMLATAKVLTLALTRKAMLTAARFVRLRERTYRKKDPASCFRPVNGDREKVTVL